MAISVLMLLSVTACVDDDQPETTITAVYPKHGGTVVLANDKISDFLTNYAPQGSRGYYDKTDCYVNKPLTLSWNCNKSASSFSVRISQDEDFNDAETYVTTENSLTLEDLFVSANYFWDVTASVEGALLRSETFSFTTGDTPRSIFIDGVSNTRDLGGVLGLDGKRVLQGLVFRGAKLDNITAAGLVKALDVFKIRTELDLRKEGEGAPNCLGEGVNYVQYSGPYYTGLSGIQVEEFRENLVNEIRIFADKDNYPIFFHCSIGRDRTGTLAMLLQGLLGVSEMDMYIDYEMSFFSASGTLDNQTPAIMVGVHFADLVSYLKEYSTGSLNENIESFVRDIGVTDTEIAAIRSILLG